MFHPIQRIPPVFKNSTLMKEGIALMEAGRLEQSIACFDAIQSQLQWPSDPAGLEALTQKAKVFYKLGREEEAVSHFDTAAFLDPGFTHQQWAHTLREIGRPLDALGHTQLACELHPNKPALWAELASILANLGRTEQARSTLHAAVTVAPRDPTVRYVEGDLFWQSGQFDRAADSYRRVLDEMPRHTKAQGKLGALLLHQGNFSEAASLLAKALDTLPDDPWLLVHQAHALAELKQAEAAQDSLSRSNGQPLPPRLQLQRAQVHLLLSNNAGCIHDCTQVLVNLPENHQAYAMRATALLNSGLLNECKSDLEAAIEKNPDNPSSYTNLGRLYLHAGDAENARRMLERARKIDGQHKSVTEFSQQLGIEPPSNNSKSSRSLNGAHNESNPHPVKRRKIADSARDLNVSL